MIRRVTLRPARAPVALAALWISASLKACADAGPPEHPAPVGLDHLSAVGCLECDGPELFDAVFSAFPVDDSTVVTVNRTDPRIRVFDADGEHRASWGRTGEGPGEFETYVLDAVPSPEGGILAVTRTPEAWMLDGTHAGRRPLLDRLWGGVNGFQNWRLSATSPSSRWLARVGGRDIDDTEYIEVQVADLVAGDSTRFAVPEELFAPSDPGSRNAFWIEPAIRNDGAWAVVGALDYEIRLFSSTGELLAAGTRGTPRVERSAEEIEASRTRPLPRPLPAGVQAPEPVVASFKPQTSRNAFFDTADRLWVLTRDGDLDVFSPDLTYLGTVDGLPQAIFRMQIRGDLVVAIHSGQLGESYVSTYRLTEAPADG